MHSKDQAAILRDALTRAGFPPRIDDADGTPVATASRTFDGEPVAFRIDAPEGWLRVATEVGASTPDVVTRANLSLAYLETGLAHVHVDDARGLVRIAASLLAVDDAPSAAAMSGTLAHLAHVRRKLVTGEGEIRASTDALPAASDPTLAQAAERIGRTLALVPDRAAFVGGLREPTSGVECAFRLHVPMPGVLAFDAWALPPSRLQPEEALFVRIDAFNVDLPAGAMLLLPGAGLLIHRWSCPLAWLDLDALGRPLVATSALEAFMRWRR